MRQMSSYVDDFVYTKEGWASSLLIIGLSKELQITEMEERAIVREAQTGSRRVFLMGYITPAAMGTVMIL